MTPQSVPGKHPAYVIEVLVDPYSTDAVIAGRQFVKNFDPDAHDGGGSVETTRDPGQAKTFPDATEAMAFYTQESQVRPLRDDGKPNRPLTAFTVVVIPLDSVVTP